MMNDFLEQERQDAADWAHCLRNAPIMRRQLAEPLSDRARQAVAFDTADLPEVHDPVAVMARKAAILDEAMASWLSRRPTGAELATAVAALDGPDDDDDDDEPAVSEYDPGDEVDDEGGMSEYRSSEFPPYVGSDGHEHAEY